MLKSPCIRCGSRDRRASGRCRPCSQRASASWRARNRERSLAAGRAWRAANEARHKAMTRAWRLRNRDRANAQAPAWRARNPERVLLIAARHRAKKLRVPFNLELEDIVIPRTCPALGIPLSRGKGKSCKCDNSPTLDRIVPELGYVKGNVQVISGKANRIKNDATPEEVAKVARFLKRRIA